MLEATCADEATSLAALRGLGSVVGTLTICTAPIEHLTYCEGGRCQYGTMIFFYLPRHEYICLEAMRQLYNAQVPWVQRKTSAMRSRLPEAWLDREWAAVLRRWSAAVEQARFDRRVRVLRLLGRPAC